MKVTLKVITTLPLKMKLFSPVVIYFINGKMDKKFSVLTKI